MNKLTTFSDVVRFHGHPKIRALHPRTIEVTTENHLTINGDCIIGVGADKGILDLSAPVRNALKADASRVRLTLQVEDATFSFNAKGSSALPLEGKIDMVIRRSDYICARTLAIGADASCMDIPRGIVQRLRSPGSEGILKIEAGT